MSRFVIIPQHQRGKSVVKKHVRRIAAKKSGGGSGSSGASGGGATGGGGGSVEENIKSARSQKLDTLGFHGNNPERQKLHKEIEDKIFSGEKTKNKVFYMTGGAPANGKSTYLESEFSAVPKKGIVEIDSDAIKGGLPEYNYLLKKKDRGAAAFVHEESSALSKKFVKRSISEGNDTLLDGVGDGGYEKLKSKIAGYKANGHKVNANYVTLDTELSVKIARARAKKTGRYVPISYVRAMNKEVSRIVPKALKDNLFDKFSLWDTNTQGKPREIIRHENGKTKVVNKELWNKFLAKGGKRNVSSYSGAFD